MKSFCMNDKEEDKPQLQEEESTNSVTESKKGSDICTQVSESKLKKGKRTVKKDRKRREEPPSTLGIVCSSLDEYELALRIIFEELWKQQNVEKKK